jgi:[acyl-carrier-protein] S-malonyltransferase
MGKELAEAFPVAKAVFDEVDEALGQKLSAIMWDGPAEDLTLTSNTQPALMAHSIATFRVLESEAGLKLDGMAFVAGHSLGEYSALCAAGAISLSDTAKLLRIRGDAMQAAVPVGEGAMAAILNLTMEQVEAVCDAASGDGVCEIANDNSPGQIVISGGAKAIETAIAAAKEAGAKRALPLPVSAPFHCSLMRPAATRMADALSEVDIAAPAVPVMANVTAEATQDPNEIRNLLVQQVTGRVRWTDSVEAMVKAGVDTFVEAGSGKVLAGLVKRIHREANAVSIGAPSDLAKYQDL